MTPLVHPVNGSLNPQLGSYNPGDWCSIIINDDFVRLRLSSYIELNAHYIYNIAASKINGVLKNKNINKGSKDYFYIQILTRYISDLSMVKVIALSDFKIRHRNYSRLLGTLKIPNAVHSSRNSSATYKGDSNISTPEQQFSIQVGRYCDHSNGNNLIVMAFKVHTNE